jgi:hypothetical protein
LRRQNFRHPQASTPRPTPTLKTSSPCFGEYTSAPSVSRTSGGNANSPTASLVATCSRDTVFHGRSLLLTDDFALAPVAARRKRRDDRYLKFYELLDNLNPPQHETELMHPAACASNPDREGSGSRRATC